MFFCAPLVKTRINIQGGLTETKSQQTVRQERLMEKKNNATDIVMRMVRGQPRYCLEMEGVDD